MKTVFAVFCHRFISALVVEVAFLFYIPFNLVHMCSPLLLLCHNNDNIIICRFPDIWHYPDPGCGGRRLLDYGHNCNSGVRLLLQTKAFR